MTRVTGLFNNARSSRTVAAGTIIFREGDLGEEMYGIVEGAVELRTSRGAVYQLGPDDTFGELALIDSEPRMATALATSDTTLATIDRRMFLLLVHETPMFALHVMTVMAQRLRARE